LYLVARDLAEHRVSDSGIELRAEFEWPKRLSQQAAALREFFGEPPASFTSREVRRNFALRRGRKIAGNIKRDHPGRAFTV
jgi:hypothetical protein